MKRYALILSVLIFAACLPANSFALSINIDIPVPVPVVVVQPAPSAVVVQPAQPAEPVPPQEQYPQDYQQQDQGQQEYPADDYIPEGDPTPPPALTVQNPDMVVVPSGDAEVYMVPNMAGVYFYGGTWYRFHHGVWFTASAYNAPWVVVETGFVPNFVVSISPAYTLYLPPTYYRIHYSDFHRNWRTWDHERRWERERWYQNERRADVRQARERQAHARMQKDRQLRDQRIRQRGQTPHKAGQMDRHRPTSQPGPRKQGQFEQRKPMKTGPQKLQNKQLQQKPKSQLKSQPKPHEKAHEKPKEHEREKH